MAQYTSEVRDGMRIDWDVPIRMEDGVTLRADVFRPVDDGRYPVIMTHGPYAKGLAFQDGFRHVDSVVHQVSRGSGRIVYQVSELGDRGPREVGTGRVCVRPGGLARRGPFHRISRHFFSPGNAGLLRVHRVGRYPGVE
jgi:hypothetical protein